MMSSIMGGLQFLSVLILITLFLLCNGSIHDKLSYHEVINAHESRVRDRRSVNEFSGKEKLVKEFHFQAFNRTFKCHLTPRTNFFSPNFKLRVFGADGVPRIHKFSTDQIFVGKCDEDPHSEIRGVFEGGIFSGSVTYGGQMYGIEDAKHHIPASDGDFSHEKMIVYKTSDMKWEKNGHGPAFCGNHGSLFDENIVVDNIVTDNSRRYKRATIPTRNTCRIITVADYKFFREIGGSNIYTTAIHMAGVMDSVDRIYRSTEFRIGESATIGLGFEIGEMDIYEAPTAGFNRDTGSWDALSLLQAFSKNVEYDDYCVAHLFTHQSFSGNVLGMAYIAPPRTGGLGGICSPTTAGSSPNTGFSSTRNSRGEIVLMKMAELVTAHELGHNWGAEHDPEGCTSSGQFRNGNFLMYQYSVSGLDSNNYLFSKCSRDLISAVLTYKAGSCFNARTFTENFACGNGLRDGDEECDAGFIGRFNLDKCCDSSCSLVGGATCSPVNSECCYNCQIATAGTVCRSDNNVDCFKSAVCDGFTLNCPQAEFKDDGTACLDEGECFNGTCRAFCEAKGLEPCACSDLASSCQRCCRASNSLECTPYDNNHPLPDGRPCVGGYCEGAVCKASTSSSIQRLFDILENLDIDSVVQFFRDNIVGCIIVFSLILWIPICIIISCKDHRTKKRLNRSEEIDVRVDRALVFDEDGRKVIQSAPTPRSGTTSPRYRTANFTDLGGFGSDA